MKKVFLGIGHGGKDPGARGNGMDEADVNLDIGLACRDVLAAHGVLVKMSRERDEDDDLNEEVRECNAYAPDLAVDIHTNAGGGVGFEVFHSIGGGVGKLLAQNIEAEVVRMGRKSRGLKTRKNAAGRDYYGFIRLTQCPAVICECAFIDSADAKNIDTQAERQAYGRAYAYGILKTLGIQPEEKEDDMKRYNSVDECPEWARDTVNHLVTRGYLKGDGADLDLSEDMMRILVINDRAGLYI